MALNINYSEAPDGAEWVSGHIRNALEQAPARSAPYRHWIATDLLPARLAADLRDLPFSPPSLDGVSGSREVHNATRVYVDSTQQASHGCCAQLANSFQDDAVVQCIERCFGADLNETYLRIEYAQDIDGFWLKPHTDIGVKRFTLLLYLSDDPQHVDLGTDIYASADQWVTRSQFYPNLGFIFVPSNDTWHGFEQRKISGVRKSVIINYVTPDWRAREQLAFPDNLIRTESGHAKDQ